MLRVDSKMPVQDVYVVCNDCKKPFRSGLVADDSILADRPNSFRSNQSRCPFCGQRVLWSKAEVYPESVARQVYPGAF